jgi:hypothetical protein
VACDQSWVRVFELVEAEGDVVGATGDACGRITVTSNAGVKLGGNQRAVYRSVAQLDGFGNLRYARELPPKSTEPFRALLAADSHSNLYVAGTFDKNFALDGHELQAAVINADDVYLAKLDREGHALWIRSLASTADGEWPTALAVDEQDRVVVGGAQEGGLDAGGGPLPGRGFLAVFAPDGSHVFSIGFGTGNTRPNALAFVGGDIFLTGWFGKSLSIAGGPVLEATDQDGAADLFLARLTSSGSHVFSARHGNSGDQEGRVLAVDGAGRLLLAGDLAGELDLGGGPLFAPDGVAPADSFAAELDLDGAHVSSRVLNLAIHDGIPLFHEHSLVDLAVDESDARTLSVWRGAGAVARLDDSLNVVDVQDLGNSPAPQLATIPGGTVLAGVSVGSIDLDVGPIPESSLYVVRRCDSP